MDFESFNSIRPAYDDATRELRFLYLKYGFFIALVLILAGGVMDITLYPDQSLKLICGRLICDAALLMLAPFIFWLPAGKKYSLTLTTILIALPSLLIAWMVSQVGGVESPYYNGLLLMIVTGCMLPLYTPKQYLVFCSFIVSLYLVACLVNGNTLSSLEAGLFTNNVFFLIATGAMCVATNIFDNRRRQRDFELSYQLSTTLDELRKTQARLIQNEKMSGLGSLAAGLLHEVNNPLNYATLACKTAASVTKDDEMLSEVMTDIQDGLDRIGGVISDLRAFAYPEQSTHFDEFELCKAVDTGVRFTSHMLEDVRITNEIDEFTRAYGSASLLSQVFVNAIANAAKAIQRKKREDKAFKEIGIIRISANSTGENENSQSQGTWIRISDNGPGIPKEILPRVFDPFFTTSSVGEGSGLGLSVCHSIVKFHRGEIDIESGPQGTTLVIFLPAMSYHEQHREEHQLPAAN